MGRACHSALGSPSGSRPFETTAPPGGRRAATRLAAMEAVFISLMALVVILTGFVSLTVLYKLFKANGA